MKSRQQLKQGDKLFLGNDVYTINSLVAEGGTSLIYDAERLYCETAEGGLLCLSKKVLIKEIAPFNMEFIRDKSGRITFLGADTAAVKSLFENEVACIAEIQRRNASTNRLPDMDSFGEYNNTYYIAMNHIKGELLSTWLRRKRPDDAEIMDIFVQILHIVAFLHDSIEDYCHLDIKPSNFIIDETGDIFMFDFGSSLIREDKWVNNYTEDYSAPEVVYNEIEKVDRRADIYSLGAVLYELVTGTRPSLERFLLCHESYCPSGLLLERSIITSLLEKNADGEPLKTGFRALANEVLRIMNTGGECRAGIHEYNS